MSPARVTAMRERLDLQKIRACMAEYGVDLAILMSPALAEYATGLMPLEHRDFCPEERSMIFAVFRDHDPFVVFRNRTLYRGVDFTTISDVYPCELMLPEKIEVLVREITERGFVSGNIGVEADSMPTMVRESLAVAFPDAEFVDISPLSRQLIVPKDEEQLMCIERALAASEEGMSAMFHELTSRADTAASVSLQDMYDLYRETISPYRVQCFDAYHLVQDGAVKPGEMKVFDIVTSYKGYLADIALPYYFGDDPPGELVDRVEIGRKIIATVASAVALNMTGEAAEKTMDSSLRDVFASQYDPLDIAERWVIHGLGLRIHEEPLLGADYRAASRDFAKKVIRFEKGCVISIEICGLMEQMHRMTDTGMLPLGRMEPRLYSPVSP